MPLPGTGRGRSHKERDDGKKTERASGIELLRIVCMVLIVAHHYSVHGGYEAFTAGNLSAGRVFLQIISLFGRNSCSVFVLISGFFMIESSGKKHYRKLVPFLAEMVFYSVGIWLLLAGIGHAPFSWIDAVESLFPLLWGQWFVQYYVLLYILVPFLNPMLRSLSKRTYGKMLAVVFLLWSVVPTLTLQSTIFGSMDFFLVMYITGGYIRLHVYGKTTYKNGWNLAAALTSAALLILSVLALDGLGLALGSDFVVGNATHFREYNSLLSVVFAVSLFLYFANLRLRSGAVNRLAGSMMGVYLIHDNGYMRPFIWKTLFPNGEYVAAPYLHALIKIPAVFFCCVAIDLIRRATVGKWFDRWFYTHCDRMCARFTKRLPASVRAWLAQEGDSPAWAGADRAE